MKPQRLFKMVLPHVEVASTQTYHGDTSVSLTNLAAEEHALAVKLMESVGFSQTNTAEEVASWGTLEFSNQPDLFLGHNHDNDQADREVAADDETVGRSDSDRSRVSSIDGGSKRLRVLVDNESHKFADKIYTNMLDNTEDRSGYAAFLYDLDSFLYVHKNNRDALSDDADDEEPAEETASGSNHTALAYLRQLADGAAEMAARGKTGRALVLSKLMSAMSGPAGQQLIAGYEAKDAEQIGTAFDQLRQKLLAELASDHPENEDPEQPESEPEADDSKADSDTEGEKPDAEPEAEAEDDSTGEPEPFENRVEDIP